MNPDTQTAPPGNAAPAAAWAAAAAAAAEMAPFTLLPMSALALVLGLITGLGAVLFRALIGLVHNVLFLGQFSFGYNSSLFTAASPWGVLVILVPVIGGLGVTWIVSNFAPEAKGHGVPEVMDAIYYKRGIIRPAVALVKSVASALAIGSGAAVGREGPIIQIGSALGSTMGQLINMQAGQRITLVAAGAGAGIAATFNTPIGGVLFAMELMLPEFSVDTFLPVAVATGTATFIGRLFFGAAPAFIVPAALAAIPNEPGSVVTLLLYALLGVAAGVAAAAFVKVLHWLEDGFELIKNRYLRHALGMALIGLMIYGFWRAAGHYYVEGVGYASIQSILDGQITAVWFLLVLAVAKLLATSISLGSGSSGGIFSPSLFIGASLGAGFAALVSLLYPAAPVSLPAFAMVGMGAMVGGGTGAAMTAVTMIFEMTRDYNIVLPMILAVATALGTRRLLSRENMYTAKLMRRGHPVPKALHTNMFLVQYARDIMERDIGVLDEATPFATMLKLGDGRNGLRHLVVTKAGRITGALRVNMSLRRAAGGGTGTLGEVAGRDFILAAETQTVFDVLKAMTKQRASIAVIVPDPAAPAAGPASGVITKEHIADTVARSVTLYPG